MRAPNNSNGPSIGLQFQPRQPAELVICVENVAKHFADEVGCFGARVQRNLALAVIAQGAQIVDAENVIGMGVGVKHRVDLADSFANRLLAKVGRGVDQDGLARQIPSVSKAGYGGRADRSNGTRRSRSRWWAPPSKCRCPAPSALPSSCLAARGRAGSLRGTRERVRHLNVCHAQFVETVLQKCSSVEVRLPLVFVCSRPSVSMVWRAPIRSMRGCAPSSCIMPICIMALM